MGFSVTVRPLRLLKYWVSEVLWATALAGNMYAPECVQKHNMPALCLIYSCCFPVVKMTNLQYLGLNHRETGTSDSCSHFSL